MRTSAEVRRLAKKLPGRNPLTLSQFAHLFGLSAAEARREVELCVLTITVRGQKLIPMCEVALYYRELVEQEQADARAVARAA